MKQKPLRIAIIGTGNIGTDLLIKTIRSPFLSCSIFVGRNKFSPGLLKAKTLGIKIADSGINALIESHADYDLVFDATSASQHDTHWPILQKLGKIVIDLTPSNIGKQVIPAVNLTECLHHQNINMISCGGQASIPIIDLINKTHSNIEYIEVVNSIASKSAGPATRVNIDEYIETTETAIKFFSRCSHAKSILILNPAIPAINMQTTISVKVKKPNLKSVNDQITSLVKLIQTYVPGYELLVPPLWEGNRIVVIVKVTGRGDYLPQYAGNMDIINCAAIAVAERFAQTLQG